MDMTVIVLCLIPVVIILGIVFWYISTNNSLKKLEIKVEESMSGIDVALTKRFDLLTKAISTCKGYAKHEQETLEKIVKMRNPGQNASQEEKQEFANKMTEGMNQMNLIVERYPELKADTQFSHVQEGIAECEEHLQAARRVFNSNVTRFNQAIVVFPSSIVANMLHLTKKEFFEAEAAKRADVVIDF